MGKNSVEVFFITGKVARTQNGPCLLFRSHILKQESRAVSDMNMKDKSSSGDTKQ